MGLLEWAARKEAERAATVASAMTPILEQRDRQQRQADLQQQAGLLAPFLNRYGPDAAKAIGGALMAGGPAAGLALQQLQQAEFKANPQAVPQEPLFKISAEMLDQWTPESVQTAYDSQDVSLLRPRTDELARARMDLAWARQGLAERQAGRLSENQITSLADMSEATDRTQELMSTADPRFFGFGLDELGDLTQAAKRRFGDDYEFTNWWQDYNDYWSLIRKGRAGVTLTPYEIKDAEKYKVRPSDSYGVAMRNMQRQNRILTRAFRRQSSALQESGRDVPGSLEPQAPQRRSLEEIFGAGGNAQP